MIEEIGADYLSGGGTEQKNHALIMDEDGVIGLACAVADEELGARA